MQSATFYRPKFWLLLLLASVVVLGACGRDRQPTATELPPTTESTPQVSSDEQAVPDEITQADGIDPDQADNVANVVGVNLLATNGLQYGCDHSENAVIECELEEEKAIIAVETPGSDFARWRLWWGKPTEKPLDGSETLHIRLQIDGSVTPHLYLVDESEQRITTKLRFSKSNTDWQDIYVPLAEIQDDDGNRPDYATIEELQIVFEWADMDGEVAFQRIQFESAWVEQLQISDEALALTQSLSLPDEFEISPLINGLSGMTQIQYVNESEALVSLQNGRVWRLRDTDGDQTFDQRTLYFAGVKEIVGLLHDPTDNSVWLGGRGKLYRTVDADSNGVADQVELRVDGLPWGRHQNNGLTWNPDPDPFTDEPGGHYIYFGLGSTEDLEIGGELNATILRFPKDGQGQEDLEIVSAGNRNAYDVVWGQVAEDENKWHLFASENGPDFNDAPDEVNHIRWQHHYGFPEHFGVNFDDPATEIDGWPYRGSLYDVTAHASSSGLAYVSNPKWPAEYQGLYVSLFGQVFDDAIVGHTVEHIALSPVETETGLTFRGEPTTFISGLDRPLPMTTDMDGNLVVGDYATGVIYRITYAQ